MRAVPGCGLPALALLGGERRPARDAGRGIGLAGIPPAVPPASLA
jgi:hypothetical protein